MSQEALDRIALCLANREDFLDLSNCGIRGALPTALAELTWLDSLILKGNDLSQEEELDSEDANHPLQPLASLSVLRVLDLDETGVRDLWPLRHLGGLDSLSLKDTQVSDLRPLQGLVGLSLLNIEGTNVDDLSPLSGLLELDFLNLDRTMVSDLTPLSGLEKLDLIYFSKTRVSSLRPIESRIRAMASLSLWDCPLVDPPLVIAEQGNEAIIRCWEAERLPIRSLDEVRILLLGLGSRLKQETAASLCGDFRESSGASSEEIRVTKVGFLTDHRCILAHCWDFGSSMVYGQIHRIYESPACIHVVFLDAHYEHEDLEYWIGYLQSLPSDARVVVVIDSDRSYHHYHSIDEHIVRQQLHRRMGNLHFVKGRHSSLEILDRIRLLVQAHHWVETPVPLGWREAMRKLEGLQTEILPIADYHAVCQESGIDAPADQVALLEILHGLGIVWRCGDLGSETIVRNTDWLNAAILRACYSDYLRRQGAILDREALAHCLFDKAEPGALDPERYRPSMIELVIQVMVTHRFVFPIAGEGDKNRWLMTKCLPYDGPPLDWKDFDGIMMEWRSEGYIPFGVIAEFIAQMFPFVVPGKYWCRGVALEFPELAAEAFISHFPLQNRIRLQARGENLDQVLQMVRSTFKSTHGEFGNVHLQEYLPLHGGIAYVRVGKLLEMQAAGQQEYFSDELKLRFRIVKLLAGIQS